MKTLPLYFDEPRYKADAKILAKGEDERGQFILLDRTIFYPQGGGQPYDIGTIDTVAVTAVRLVDEEVRHYVASHALFTPDQNVDIGIDEIRRKAHSRYHTAGHLLSHIVEGHYPALKGVKGHHYLDGAYVEFLVSKETNVDLFHLNQELKKAIEADYLIRTWIEAERRFVKIGSFDPYYCGGTHVGSLKELSVVTATKLKKSQGSLRISYTV